MSLLTQFYPGPGGDSGGSLNGGTFTGGVYPGASTQVFAFEGTTVGNSADFSPVTGGTFLGGSTGNVSIGTYFGTTANVSGAAPVVLNSTTSPTLTGADSYKHIAFVNLQLSATGAITFNASKALSISGGTFTASAGVNFAASRLTTLKNFNLAYSGPATHSFSGAPLLADVTGFGVSMLGAGIFGAAATFAGCSLTADSIGVITSAFAYLEANSPATINGTLTFTGGSNAPSTTFSAQTIADIAYLNANGWTVTTN